MNRGHVHELGRTARSRLLLVLAVVVAVGGPLTLLGGPTADSPPGIATVFYYGHGAYHLLALVYDVHGQPMPGRSVSFSSPYGLPAGATTSGVTDARGLVSATVPSAYNNTSIAATVATPGGTTTVLTQLSNYPVQVLAGTVVPGFGDLVNVRTGAYAVSDRLLAFFAGPNGTTPSGIVVQFHWTAVELSVEPVSNDTSNGSPTGPNITVLTLDGSYSAVAALPVPVPPIAAQAPDLTVQIVGGRGAVLDDAFFTTADFGPQSIAPPAALDAELALSELGLAGLVAGLLGGLFVYGTDRLSGTLDPYLARPVSAPGFLGARYVGALVPLALGTAAGVGAIDAGLAARFGAAMPPGLLAVALASSVGAVAAWLAVPFALAHVVRTPSLLTTTVVGVLVVFGFLWTPTSLAIAPLLGVGPGMPGAATFQLDAELLNPALAPSALVPAAVSGTDRVTAAAVAVVAALWIGVPLAVALHRARNAD